jgi:hypothetical protein
MTRSLGREPLATAVYLRHFSRPHSSVSLSIGVNVCVLVQSMEDGPLLVSVG